MTELGTQGHAAVVPAAGACECNHQHDRNRTESTSRATNQVIVAARAVTVTKGARTILHDIDLEVSRGEIVTLIGPNGAGKTTLVRVLLGLETPSRGSVTRADGTVIGYVPQRIEIDRALPMTVRRFLRHGLQVGEGEIHVALHEVDAHRVADRQLSVLSGGEFQRVLLARALLRNPDLLVLDEPARGVDYSGEAELYALISHIRDARGVGVLLVSHDLHVVMAASDRVVCLNHHICCSGVPHAVARHPEYARLFGPKAADAFAVYEHHHDHRHDLSGEQSSP